MQAALEGVGLRAGDAALHIGRHFSLRDLFKWCRRLEVWLSFRGSLLMGTAFEPSYFRV